MKEGKELFFKGIESKEFRAIVERCKDLLEFEQNYDLNNNVDTNAEAKIGAIKITDISGYDDLSDYPVKVEMKVAYESYINSLKNGLAIPLLIVQSPAKLNSTAKYELLEGKFTHFAAFKAGIEYLPALVYDGNQELDFDNSKSVLDFLNIDPAEVYNGTSNSTTDSTEDTYNALVGNKYFEDRPEKVLGTEYETTDAYNKEVLKVKGSLDEALERIDTNTTADEEEDISVLDSVEQEEIEDIVDTKDKEENVKRAIQLQKERTDEDRPEMQSFEETIKRYNDQLSDDEIRAWIWYKRETKFFQDENLILQKDNGWSKYIIHESQEKEWLDQWVQQGVMCYINRKYIPSVLYYSGNIYNKISELLANPSSVVDEYGQDQYDRQWEGLHKVLPQKLTLTDPIKENRLTILLVSDIAKEVKIKELADGTTFVKEGSNELGKSLVSAFTHWMKTLPQDKFKKSTTWEIERYYIANRTVVSGGTKDDKIRRKENAKIEAEQLFAEFLETALLKEDQTKLEYRWNSRFNGYVPVNYFKVPIGFSCSSTFKNKPLFIRPAQREGLGFLAINGTGCIAYDVGVGKTMTGILSIAQAIESGMCTRPLIVVPNQTYKNWLAEIQGVFSKKGTLELTGVLPQYKVNDLYNLGEKHVKKLQDKYGNLKEVEAGSISVITYEGLRKIGFNEETWVKMGKKLYTILNQGDEWSTRKKAALYNKITDTMGLSLKGSLYNIEDLGFDYILHDEAHNMKKIFTSVKGTLVEDGEKRLTKRYKISSGQPSTLGLKSFMLSQYILQNNENRNVVLLTATPFTNNPLEIFSMLSLMGFASVVDEDIKNLQGFFNQFIKSSMQLTINAKMKPEKKEVVLGFNNLIALQQLIFRFIDYKSGEDAKIQRPNKWVLPLTHKTVGEDIIPLPKSEQISTNLSPTDEQKTLMAELEQYVVGKKSFSELCANPTGVEDSEGDESSGEVIDEKHLNEEDEEGARVLRGISLARQIAFSPYLFACHSHKKNDIDYKKFIASSPKLQYVMGCIKTVKNYHDKHGEKVSGQVIYSNAGVKFFPLISEYLQKELGFQASEIGSIIGGMTAKKKEAVKEKFQSGEIKVLLGSNSIKEGINLQNRATVLYDLWLDWNPTDIKQLEGRIWRFGNMFANVRIVLPLMEDSIDTAIFQKLEEKTSRINEIWHRSGQANSLKLEEFNPAELKIGLITNTDLLAEITLMEEEEIIKDEISHLINQKKELEQIAESRDYFNRYIDQARSIVDRIKPLNDDEEPRSDQAVLRWYKKLANDASNGLSYEHVAKSDQLWKAHNSFKNGLERILKPRGMDADFEVNDVIGKIEEEIDVLIEKMKERTGEEAIKKLSRKIMQDRINSGYKPRTVHQRVEEFASLNDQLLSEKLFYDEKEKVTTVKKPKSAKLLKMEKELAAMEEMALLIAEMEGLKRKAA